MTRTAPLLLGIAATEDLAKYDWDPAASTGAECTATVKAFASQP